MSSKPRSPFDELIRDRMLLGERLSEKDGDYALYAGKGYELAKTISRLKWILDYRDFLELNLHPIEVKWIEAVMALLQQEGKANFMTVDSDVLTKLSVLVGHENDNRSGTERHIPYRL